MQFSIQRYNPEVDKKPYLQDYEIGVSAQRDMMALEALLLIKEQRFPLQPYALGIIKGVSCACSERPLVSIAVEPL